MESVNLFLLLIPKANLACLDETMNVRQALEKMHAHGYSAVPLVSQDGKYLGTISDGDLLWCIVDNDEIDLEGLEEINICDIVRNDSTQSCKADASIDDIIDLISKQNYVPVVDDRNILMGIVTRKKVIEQLVQKK